MSLGAEENIALVVQRTWAQYDVTADVVYVVYSWTLTNHTPEADGTIVREACGSNHSGSTLKQLQRHLQSIAGGMGHGAFGLQGLSVINSITWHATYSGAWPPTTSLTRGP